MDVADIIIETVKQKALCSLKLIKGVMTTEELRKLYDEFKALTEAILQKDLHKCTITKDVDLKSR